MKKPFLEKKTASALSLENGVRGSNLPATLRKPPSELSSRRIRVSLAFAQDGEVRRLFFTGVLKAFGSPKGRIYQFPRRSMVAYCTMET